MIKNQISNIELNHTKSITMINKRPINLQNSDEDIFTDLVLTMIFNDQLLKDQLLKIINDLNSVVKFSYEAQVILKKLFVDMKYINRKTICVKNYKNNESFLIHNPINYFDPEPALIHDKLENAIRLLEQTQHSGIVLNYEEIIDNEKKTPVRFK